MYPKHLSKDVAYDTLLPILANFPDIGNDHTIVQSIYDILIYLFYVQNEMLNPKGLSYSSPESLIAD